MGETANVGMYEDCKFFFELMANIRESYPIVFKGHGSPRPRTAAYTAFKEKWGIIDIFYQMCNEEITKIGEIYQIYLADFLQYLSWSIEKQDAEREQEKYEEQLRKSKRGR